MQIIFKRLILVRTSNYKMKCGSVFKFLCLKCEIGSTMVFVTVSVQYRYYVTPNLY